MFLSVVTIGELERGIARQIPQDPNFARDLAQWGERILAWFADRILPVDAVTARRWGRLSASRGNQDMDLLIAATALEHGLDRRDAPERSALRTGGSPSSTPGTTCCREEAEILEESNPRYS